MDEDVHFPPCSTKGLYSKRFQVHHVCELRCVFLVTTKEKRIDNYEKNEMFSCSVLDTKDKMHR